MRDGLTLLEAVLSLAIISLVGLAALGAVGRDLRTAVNAKVALEVAMLADDRLETTRLADPATLAVLPDSLASGVFAAPFDEYRWNIDTRPVPGSVQLYDVRVTVHWAEGSRSYRARFYRPAGEWGSNVMTSARPGSPMFGQGEP